MAPEDGPLPASPPTAPLEVNAAALFLGFLKIGLLGFGGVAPWARHVIVEDRGWLSEAEYAAVLGVGQVLPGANTVNAAVMIGDRFAGFPGAVAAVAGLMAMPLAILIGLAQVYAAFSSDPTVQAALAGSAAAAAGLVIGTGLKMAWRLKPSAGTVVAGLLALGAVAILQLPLVLVIAVLGPLSIGVVALEARR